MTGRIVVGVDGSPQSARALEWAVARAVLGGEELELLNAYSHLPSIDFFGYHGPSAGEQMEWFMEFSDEVLAAASTRVRELAPHLACTVTSQVGHPAPTLTAASEGAVAVVVGRRGLGGAAGALLGSVSNRLTVQAKCPVVVVGEAELPASGPVVVGLDDSPYGANALRYAIAEAALRKTGVRVVAAYDVIHQGFRGDPEHAEGLRASVESEVERAVAQALEARAAEQGSGPAVDVQHVAVEGRAAEAILSHADDAQLVVVGTHGKGLVRRVLLGSVSRQVLADADRPVAVVDLPDA